MGVPLDIAPDFPIETIAVPEQNFRAGRSGKVPDCIVIHVVEGSKSSCIQTFKDPKTQKSTHFLVGKDGSVVQFVSTKDTAFGNGIVDNPISGLLLSRPGVNPNLWTISIEHEGKANDGLTVAQEASSIKLVKFLAKKWAIPLDRTHVIRHTEIYAGKVCPGAINVEKILQKARLL